LNIQSENTKKNSWGIGGLWTRPTFFQCRENITQPENPLWKPMPIDFHCHWLFDAD